ncbi:TPA: hypothetical protein NHZ32_003396 [Pseudomonas aeruginosa]|nr:hypothetical protein [Pseudomonas aeruginosa]HCE9195355.1 hypothetical protein [Pseudomonas aeruginosa]
MKNTPKEGLSGAGRVAFLARLEEFRVLIQAGWPVTVVYENHGGDKTSLSYSQFARYVGKYIRTPTKRGAQRARATDGPPPQRHRCLNKGNLPAQRNQAPCRNVSLGFSMTQAAATIVTISSKSL